MILHLKQKQIVNECWKIHGHSTQAVLFMKKIKANSKKKTFSIQLFIKIEIFYSEARRKPLQ